MTERIDRFIPAPDVRHRHEIRVRAPADVVFEVAEALDIQSLPIVHAIFWLRAKLMRAREVPRDRMKGLLQEMRSIGWAVLAREPGRILIMGAATQPWVPDVTFTPIQADGFASYSQPDQVKIVWTLEAEPLDPARTRFSTETRAVATDEDARRKFRRYWRTFGVGIVLIRWLLLPAVRRKAERRFRRPPVRP